MAIITRDKAYGWNVKLTGLPPLWFAERAAILRFLSSVDGDRCICG